VETGRLTATPKFGRNRTWCDGSSGFDAVRGGNVAAKLAHAEVGRGEALAVTLRLIAAAVQDAARGVLGLAPRYLAVYGRAGEAFFAAPDLAERFRVLSAGSTLWQNRVAARFLLSPPRYRRGPLERIRVPILFTIASRDLEGTTASPASAPITPAITPPSCWIRPATTSKPCTTAKRSAARLRSVSRSRSGGLPRVFGELSADEPRYCIACKPTSRRSSGKRQGKRGQPRPNEFRPAALGGWP
jgi:hypothetical protein